MNQKQKEGECTEGIICTKEENEGNVVRADEEQEKFTEENSIERETKDGKDKGEDEHECSNGEEEEEQEDHEEPH